MSSTGPRRLSEDKLHAELLPCENDQAKLDRISRLARSTNLSKILESDPPERALLDRGPDCYVGVSSNLLRSPISAT